MSTVHLKVPEGVYPRILERMQAAKRDIDLVAGGTSAVTVHSTGPVPVEDLRAAVDEAGYELAGYELADS